MFAHSKFNKDIHNWNINSTCRKNYIFSKCPINKEYKPKKLSEISETFDFNSVNKQKKTINAYDMVLFPIINKIKHYESLTKDEYNILISYTGIYKVTSKNDLIGLLNYAIDYFGNHCDLNWIDISEVTDLSELFFRSNFKGDISKWNTGNVTDMYKTFQ
jgi:surface protein